MLEAMLDSGDLPDGGTIVEPTAGNTGSGLAVAANQLGVRAVFVVPERFSVEKQTLMRALGADVINTPTEPGMGGAIERAHDLAEELDDAVVPQQFSNPLNAEAHYEPIAPEIYDALDGGVGAIVAGCGTAGTLMGMARYAREHEPGTHVCTVPRAKSRVYIPMSAASSGTGRSCAAAPSSSAAWSSAMSKP